MNLTQTTEASNDEDQALCPLCGRDLEDLDVSRNLWICRCGEVIPDGLEVSPRMRPPSSDARSTIAELESTVRQGGPRRKRS